MICCKKLRVLALASVFGFAFAACGEDETGPELPGATTVQIATTVDTVTVAWTAVTGVTSYRVELRTNPDTLRKTALASESEAVFTTAEGVADDVTYTAVVYSINDAGETASANAPSILTDFFPWDDHYLTSLHATGQGKRTFYNASPNQGFERFTSVPYANLACKNCHEPAARRVDAPAATTPTRQGSGRPASSGGRYPRAVPHQRLPFDRDGSARSRTESPKPSARGWHAWDSPRWIRSRDGEAASACRASSTS